MMLRCSSFILILEEFLELDMDLFHPQTLALPLHNECLEIDSSKWQNGEIELYRDEWIEISKLRFDGRFEEDAAEDYWKASRSL